MPNDATRFQGFANVNAIDLARLEANEVRGVLKVLEDLEADIVRVLSREKPSIRNQKRIAEVRRSVEDAINQGYSIIKIANDSTLGDLAKVSHESTVAAINKAAGASIVNPVLTENQIRNLANRAVVFGSGGSAKISQWWDGQRDDFKTKVARQLRLGYALGEGSEEIARRIVGTEGANFKDGTTAISKRNAEVLTRTSVQSISNEARLATFAQNADVIKGIQWLATLDDRTCPTCRALDGLQWELNADGSIGDPIGHSKAWPGSVAHFQCRCTTVSVTRSWEELNGNTKGAEPAEPGEEVPTKPTPPAKPTPRPEDGASTLSKPKAAPPDPGPNPDPTPVPAPIPRNTNPGEKPDEPVPIPARPTPRPIEKGEGRKVGAMTDGEFEKRVRARMAKNGVDPEKIDKSIVRARASMDGQVPETLDFDQWLRRQPKDRRTKILGPSRVELFDRGVITTRDMTDQSNRPVTVKDLERKVELGLFIAAETEGIRQAFKALQPGAISPYVKPDVAAEVERAAAARIEGALKNPGGQEMLAGEIQRVLNETGADRLSPAEVYSRALAKTEALEAASRKANTLRNARGRIIQGNEPTPSQQRLIAALTPAEKKNFDNWVEESRGRSGGPPLPPTARTAQAEIDAEFPAANPVGRDTFDRFRVGEGFTPERERLHEEIIEDFFKDAKPTDKPVALMTGGGPASGKSVLTREGHVESLKNAVTVDSDEIKKLLPEYKLGTKVKDPNAAAYAHEESSYLSKEIMRRAAESKRNVFLDGTGDSSIESLKKKTTALRLGGQTLRANYVTVDTAEAIRRNEARAAKTGRMVPNSFVSETHKNISKIFPQILEENLFDEITLWDTNTPGKTIRVLTQRNGKIEIHDEELYRRFLDKAND